MPCNRGIHGIHIIPNYPIIRYDINNRMKGTNKKNNYDDKTFKDRISAY